MDELFNFPKIILLPVHSTFMKWYSRNTKEEVDQRKNKNNSVKVVV